MGFFTLLLHRGLALVGLTAGLALAQSGCVLPDGPLPERSRYVVMLDVSGSMVGKGDGRFDIFGQVERELGRFLQQSTSTVRLVTFSRGVEASRDFEYPTQKAELQTYLNTLKPDGTHTYLYRSMQRVFSGLTRDPSLATTVYVLTDGNDNDPGRVSLQGALATFEKSRGEFDKLYYIGLGTDIPQAAETAFDATSYARTLEVPPSIIPQLGGFGLLPALLELSKGKLTRSGRLGEDVRLELDNSRFPGLKLGQGRLAGGERLLTLTVDPARPGTPEAAALLCVEGAGLSQRALVRPGREVLAGGGPSAGAGSPGAGGPGTGSPAGQAGSGPSATGRLRLTLLNPEGNRVLSPGEETTLRYRVGGPAGGRGLVNFGTLPEGLEATVNGRPLNGPVPVTAGDTLALTLRSTGLPGGQAVSIAPTLDGQAARAQQVSATGANGSPAPGPLAGSAGARGTAESLRLVLLNPGANRSLAPGEETTLNYRLQGPAGQSGQVAFGNLPDGLEATVNGQPLTGPLTVQVGDTVALTLRNRGLPGGEAMSVTPSVDGRAAEPQQVTGRAAAGDPAGTAATGGTTPAPGTGTPGDTAAASPLRLVLLNPGANRSLAPGEETTLSYRLQGPAGQSGQVDFGALPDGLEATVNGRPLTGPLTVQVGDTVALTVRNAGLPGGGTATLTPTLNGQAAQPQQVTAATPGAAAGTAPSTGQVPAAGPVVLLNPEARQPLARGESTVLRYRAEGAPATVRLGETPAGTSVAFEGQPGSTLTVPAGGEFGVRVTNTGLGGGQAVSPDVRAAGVPLNVPTITGARAGFDPGWLGLLGLLGLLPLVVRRAAPRVLSVPVGPAPAGSPPVVTAPTPVAPSSPPVDTAPAGAAPDRLQLLEERLAVDKTRVKVGEVEIGKRVETRTEQVEVPLTREEAYIERHAVADPRPVEDAVLGVQPEALRVDLEAERAQVEKRAYVAEEVEVSKRTTTEQRTFTETVGREVLDVRPEGDVTVVDGEDVDEGSSPRRR
ncbi:DUF2382 domain-containing protein [Deinococcus aestuarii]|uniref:DUF2382 domain-containing protein n=1 Tax=Deinococcus aestuarii TaxID=2774531 RepID=UPI001C0CC865